MTISYWASLMYLGNLEHLWKVCYFETSFMLIYNSTCIILTVTVSQTVWFRVKDGSDPSCGVSFPCLLLWSHCGGRFACNGQIETISIRHYLATLLKRMQIAWRTSEFTSFLTLKIRDPIIAPELSNPRQFGGAQHWSSDHAAIVVQVFALYTESSGFNGVDPQF